VALLTRPAVPSILGLKGIKPPDVRGTLTARESV